MTDDGELPLSERKAQLAVNYLRLVAAVAGFSVAHPDSDYDSIDLTVSSRQGKRARLEFQVKCTSQALLGRDSNLRFSLSLKNYNDLRLDTIIPRLLLVVLVPESPAEWLSLDEQQMVLRRCGYWVSLRNQPDTANTSSVVVTVPRINLLTPEALKTLMFQGVPQ